MVHALSGYIDRPTPPPVVKLQICTVKEEEPGSVIATMKGGEEKWCFPLVVLQVHRGPIANERPG